MTVGTIDAGNVDQSIVYNVTYSTGSAVSSTAYTVNKLPVPVISSVSANNLKEITVKFSQKMDSTTATNLSNYTLTLPNGSTYGWTTNAGLAVNNDAAVLQADNQTVVITLKNGSEMTQQGSYALTSSGVLSPAAALSTAAQTMNFTAFDLAAPTAVSAAITGPTTLKVTYSEPVNTGFLGTYTIDNNTYSVIGTAADTDNHSVDVTLGTVLPTGTHTVAVSAVKDYAPFAVASSTLNFSYTADSSAPTVTASAVGQNSITLKFSKPVKASTQGYLSVYHSYNNVAAYAGSSASWSDNQTVTYTFSNYLPLGNATIYVNNGANTTNIVTDAWGNALTSTSFNVNVTADTTAPKVKKITVVDNTHIDVQFTKAVYGANLITNYTLTDPSANAVAVSSTTVDATDNTIYHLVVPTMAGGAYTLAIANVTDTAIALNALGAYSTAISVPDSVPPTVTALGSFSSDNTKVFVGFSEKMATSGAGSILDVNNYRLSKNDGTNPSALPAGTVITLGADMKSVVITLPTANASLGGGNFGGITVSQVRDLAGNPTIALATIATLSSANLTVANFDTTTYKAINSTQIQFNVNATLKAIDVSKFTINGAPAASASYVNNSGIATVTVTSGAAWLSDLTNLAGPNAVVIAAGGLTTDQNVANSAQINVTKALTADYVAPAVVSRTTGDSDGDGKIDKVTIVFDEPLQASSVAYDGFSVAGYTINDVTLSNGNKTITLTLTEGNYDSGVTPGVRIIKALRDASAQHNLYAAETVSTTATDGAAPVLISAVRTSANHMTMVFSEGVYTAFAAGTASGALTAADLNLSPLGDGSDLEDLATIAHSAGTAALTATTTTDSVANTSSIGAKTAASIYDAAGNAMAVFANGTSSETLVK